MGVTDRFRGVATYDAGQAHPTRWGVGGLQVRSINFTGSGRVVTDAPDSGKRLVLDDIHLSADEAMWVHLFTKTVASPFLSAMIATYAGLNIAPSGEMKASLVDQTVVCQTSASGNLAVMIGYHSDD